MNEGKVQSGCAISENCSSDRVYYKHHATDLLSLPLRVVNPLPLLDLMATDRVVADAEADKPAE